MIWQNIVITVVTIALAAFLIPTILGKQKPPLLSSIPVAIGLIILSVCFFTMNLELSGIGTSLQAATWAILIAQRLGQDYHTCHKCGRIGRNVTLQTSFDTYICRVEDEGACIDRRRGRR